MIGSGTHVHAATRRLPGLQAVNPWTQSVSNWPALF
jgi:hypothetical protein